MRGEVLWGGVEGLLMWRYLRSEAVYVMASCIAMGMSIAR